MSPAAVVEAGRVARGVAADRAFLVAGLRDGGLAAVVDPPRAPFVLARVPGAAGVRRGLRELGFAVRRGDTFPGLEGDCWLRLAVRGRETTEAFLGALRKVRGGG